ncbi:MAG: hypothetical protein P8179_02460 [Candidatus Thiodiazotropha sp.]
MRYINNLIHLIFFIIIISISFGCSGEIKTNVSCESESNLVDSLPTQVLDGTDIIDISIFITSSKVLEGDYQAEIGGAILTLTTKLTSSNSWVINRTFQEPGEKKVSRDFHLACISKGWIYSDSLVGKSVNGGILIFERKVNTEGIPDNLWIFYKLDNGKPRVNATSKPLLFAEAF